MKTLVKYFWQVVALWLLAGCSWKDSTGVRHTLVVGIGYYSTANSPVSVSDLRALGFAHSETSTALGYIRQHRVEIDPKLAGDVVVSVKSTPFSLRVQHFNCSVTNNENKSF